MCDLGFYLSSKTAKEAFNEINGFLNNHPKEVVIVDVNHFYEVNADDHTKFIRWLGGCNLTAFIRWF